MTRVIFLSSMEVRTFDNEVDARQFAESTGYEFAKDCDGDIVLEDDE